MKIHFWTNGRRSGSIVAPHFIRIGERNVILIEDWCPEGKATVPKGFISDLGSIPEPFWWIATPEDIKYSSIMHDYQFTLADDDLYSYKIANLEFLRHCCDWDRIPNWKALICFMGVEIFRSYIQIKRGIWGLFLWLLGF